MYYFLRRGAVSGPNLTKLKGTWAAGELEPQPNPNPPAPICISILAMLNCKRTTRTNILKSIDYFNNSWLVEYSFRAARKESRRRPIYCSFTDFQPYQIYCILVCSPNSYDKKDSSRRPHTSTSTHSHPKPIYSHKPTFSTKSAAPFSSKPGENFPPEKQISWKLPKPLSTASRTSRKSKSTAHAPSTPISNKVRTP